MTGRKGVLLGLVAIVASGCGQSNVDRALEQMRHSRGPRLYFLDERFAGLPLTHAASERPGHALFVYGTCEPPGGSDGGCAPPVQVQIFPFEPKMWRLAGNCRRLRSLRGVSTVRHDGLVLLTRNTVVKIYARTPAEERRAAQALRSVGAGARVGEALPPPRAAVRELVDEVCANAAAVPFAFNDFVIVGTGPAPQRRIGPFRYFESRRDYARAVRFFGRPSSWRLQSNLCVVRWRRLGLEIEFRVSTSCSASRLRGLAAWCRAKVHTRRWRTKEGLRVGDSEARLRRLYPHMRVGDPLAADVRRGSVVAVELRGTCD